MSMMWASTILAQDVCQLCSRNLKAAGSEYCLGCERELLTISIDQATRDKGELLPWKPEPRHQATAMLWALILGFGAGTLIVMLLWWISGIVS